MEQYFDQYIARFSEHIDIIIAVALGGILLASIILFILLPLFVFRIYRNGREQLHETQRLADILERVGDFSVGRPAKPRTPAR